MEKLNIKVGAKAKAIESEWHAFADGAEIEFLGYGDIVNDEEYYEYKFKGMREDTGKEGVQYLEADEFILVGE
ncbi:hypothetical protein PQE66_gp105 [Bacillus phage PBC2]|uniref:Uncharacterized protein n=1 Tax=Bacillus phage PBC2 TaxID=1675029 RepID=A0A218KBZ9_9CAUD|nr:hypothetical protein PQE66_gp105 [Bacillus phage PBC2]AKQ08420.1 hypothetical protein PBC2_105 [Bacillus phage PBC2]